MTILLDIAELFSPTARRLRRLEARVIGLTADVDHKDGVIAELRADNADLNERVECLSSTMIGMQLLVRDADDAVDGLTKDIEFKDRRLSELRAELMAARAAHAQQRQAA